MKTSPSGFCIRFLAYLLVAWAFLMNDSSHVQAADPLLFVSSFVGGGKGAIHAWRFSLTDGRCLPVTRNDGVEHPFFIAISPDQRFLYSIHAKSFGSAEEEQVAAYAIDKATGVLRLLNRQSSRGSASCFLEVDATGKTVLVANYTTGNVAALPVLEDGSIGPAASFFQHAGSGPNPARQKGPYAHSFIVSPDNRYAYAADLGIDQVLGYRLTASTAKLERLDPPSAATPPGAGPRHLAFHPNGKWLYAINELANTVTRFDYAPATGALTPGATVSTLPEGYAGVTHTADVKITPDGRFLYGTNRGHDSVAVFAIGADGVLTRVAIEPSLGKGPQNLAITADGRWLLCANMPGNNVAVFAIDRESGRLKAVGQPVEVPSPSCLRLLP
jgi:6-phosphogluconolactonase